MKENIKLQLTKIINAKRSKVFAAWCDPTIMKRWYAPAPMTVPKVEIDFKVGGKYRVDIEGGMNNQQNKDHVSGIYKEIIQDELLVFTFKGTWQGDVPESLVTITFQDVADGTEITLTHEHFVEEESRNNHKLGWQSMLENLATISIIEESV